MVTSETPKLLSFVAFVAELREAYRVESGLNYCSNMGAKLAPIVGSKFARVMSTETNRDSGAIREQIYCFIALTDSETKGLGIVKAGDVMKPATWKAPAKHARGNIFADDNGRATLNSYGPGYLR